MNQEESILSFENISLSYLVNPSRFYQKKTVETEKKTVLNGISGKYGKGLNAILGNSGAGKTSFLDILAHRMRKSKKYEFNVEVSLNGKKYDNESFTEIAGYVAQHDHLLSYLTVKECLRFIADLKLPYQEQQKATIVEQTIKQLNLTHCQDIRIGHELKRGVSGGERRRVSIGMELIGDPLILFLDEPTSGLDSFTSYKVIKILKDLSDQTNKTIIFTIHQPSLDIWNLLDNITIMSQGQFLYQGPRESIMRHFESFGMKFPLYRNPADYLIQQINAKDVQEISNMITYFKENGVPEESVVGLLPIKEDSESNYSQDEINTINLNDQKLNNAVTAEEVVPQIIVKEDVKEEKNQGNNKFFDLSKYINTNAIFYLNKRQIKKVKRNLLLTKSRIIQILVQSFFIGGIFWQMCSDNEQLADSIQTAKTLFSCSIGMLIQGMNPRLSTFLAERPMFIKETRSNLYSQANYFISKLLLDILSCTFYAFFYSIIVYWMMGLTRTFEQFIYFSIVLIFQCNIGNALGLLSGSIFKSESFSIQFSLSFLALQIFFGGLFKNKEDLRSWIAWLQYLTPTSYAFEGVVQNEFSNQQIQFNPINIHNLYLNKWDCIGYLILQYIFYNALAYLSLHHFRKKQY